MDAWKVQTTTLPFTEYRRGIPDTRYSVIIINPNGKYREL